MVSMSLQPNEDILGQFRWLPQNVSLDNYRTILTRESWYGGYINSIQYTVLNTVLSLLVALDRHRDAVAASIVYRACGTRRRIRVPV
jgi:ABC-type spermidine/putrescine transport system permease subunit II